MGEQEYSPGFNDFWDAISGTFIQATENVGNTFEANAANSAATANLNNARAASILAAAENRRRQTDGIIRIVVIVVVVIGICYLLKLVLPKLLK